jgi:hypothetical protein
MFNDMEVTSMTTSTANTGRAQQWRERIAQHKASGLSVAAFCQQEGVSTPTFYWWRSRLSRQEAGVLPGVAPAPFVDLGSMPTTTAIDAGALTIRLDLPGGLQLTITRA